MRSQFPWFEPLFPEKTNEIFRNGIISFDANVLLDIYRVDKETRDEIKKAIEQFSSQVWLSHQAASEFIKNKNLVESNSKKIFNKYSRKIDEQIQSICGDINKFQQENSTINKTVPSKIRQYINDITGSAENLKTQLAELEKTYIEELDDEKNLEWIYQVFDGKVGSAFLEKDLQELRTIAESRIASKIPPGYMDDDKNGDEKYGDFFLWKQILQKAKHDDKHIVFVTSEKKEDWFEILSGKTIQPRRELRKEALDETNHEVIIYRLGSFLRKAAQIRENGVIPESTEKAIQTISNLHRVKKAVTVINQDFDADCSDVRQSGTLTISLNVPAYFFTVTGKLEPHTLCPPFIQAYLQDAPWETMPEQYHLSFGAGTCFDFNLHFKSNDYGVQFPAGIYKIAYRAESNVINKDGRVPSGNPNEATDANLSCQDAREVDDEAAQ